MAAIVTTGWICIYMCAQCYTPLNWTNVQLSQLDALARSLAEGYGAFAHKINAPRINSVCTYRPTLSNDKRMQANAAVLD